MRHPFSALPLGRITDGREAAALDPMIGEVAGRQVLDIGCGDGTLATGLVSAGARVVGLDPDPGMLRTERDAAAAAGVQEGLASGRIETLPLPSKHFDLATAVTELCCVRDERSAWREMVRILQPGGDTTLRPQGAHRTHRS